MSITLTNITFAFRTGQPVLQDVTVSAAPGRITTIVGPNAAGKTTLLRVAAGLLEPQHGEVKISDRPIRSLAPLERARRLAYVAQRSSVDAPFKVRDVLELGCFAQHGPRSREAILESLRICELQDLADRRFHELSVGQQQRVSLARALVQLPRTGQERVLLLDEPMSAMDPKHVMQCGQLLRDLANDGATVIVVLHDLPLAFELADDVWAMSEGRILAAGPIGAALSAVQLTTMYDTPFHDRPERETAYPSPSYGFR